MSSTLAGRAASLSFERVGAAGAIGLGLGGIAYTITFLVLLYEGAPKGAAIASSVFLLAGGVAGVVVFTAVYERFRGSDPGFALLAFVLGVVGALGSAAHGGYDLANIVRTPPSLHADVPNSTDPRGFATFGLTALGIGLVSLLILRSHGFPHRLAHLGLVATALLLIIYFGRMVVYNPKSPGLLAAALITGFAVNPACYTWLGLRLWRPPSG